MKRSELLETITARLYHEDILAPECDKLAEELLNIIEAAGMQPPAIKEPCETFVLHNGRYIQTEDSFIFTHKWDEE